MKRFSYTLRKQGPAMGSEQILDAYFEAVRSNDPIRMTELLKSRLINVDARDEKAKDATALHIAADKGYYDLARLLVDEFDAPVDATDRDKKIPLELATDSYNMDIVKFLLKRNSKGREYAEHCLNDERVDNLFEAAEKNDITGVTELLKDKKVDVNSRDKSKDNRTILHVAAENGYQDLARMLVDDYAANIQLQDDPGDTAKHVAIDNRHTDIAKFFIEKGYKDPRPCDN